MKSIRWTALLTADTCQIVLPEIVVVVGEMNVTVVVFAEVVAAVAFAAAVALLAAAVRLEAAVALPEATAVVDADAAGPIAATMPTTNRSAEIVPSPRTRWTDVLGARMPPPSAAAGARLSLG